MKLCKDCKHIDGMGTMCARGERQVGVNPVSGHPEYKYKVLAYASSERGSWLPWKCGKNGRHWEKK
ncbi:hypothetical protein D3C72_1496150 [compost metagenome]